MIGMSSLLDAMCCTELDALSMYWLSRTVGVLALCVWIGRFLFWHSYSTLNIYQCKTSILLHQSFCFWFACGYFSDHDQTVTSHRLWLLDLLREVTRMNITFLSYFLVLVMLYSQDHLISKLFPTNRI